MINAKAPACKSPTTSHRRPLTVTGMSECDVQRLFSATSVIKAKQGARNEITSRRDLTSHHPTPRKTGKKTNASGRVAIDSPRNVPARIGRAADGSELVEHQQYAARNTVAMNIRCSMPIDRNQAKFPVIAGSAASATISSELSRSLIAMENRTNAITHEKRMLKDSR